MNTLLMEKLYKFKIKQKVLFFNTNLKTTKLQTNWKDGFVIIEEKKRAYKIKHSDGRTYIANENFLKLDRNKSLND